jgi:hypothetical protein
VDRGEEDIDGIDIEEGDAILIEGQAEEGKDYFKVEIS